MRWLSIVVAIGLAASVGFAAPRRAMADYLLEVQSGGPGTVDPPGPIVVPAGGSQTFTFIPDACDTTGEVTVDEAPVGTGILSYTFTNVQSDHLLYVPFVIKGSSTTLEVRPPVGQCAVPETLTAIVPNGDGGDVKFFEGQTLLATRTVSAGAAKLILDPLTVGGHTLSASFLGSNCLGASDSPEITYDVYETGPVPVTLSLALDQTTLNSPAPVKASVTLRMRGNTWFQSGQVTYYDGASVLGTAALANGVSSLTFTPTVGNHSISAATHPNACPGLDVTSNAVALQVLNRTATSLTLTLTPSPTNEGATTTMTAVISPQAVTGSVHFRDLTSGADLGTVSLANHQATMTYGGLYGANRTIQVSFDGDANYIASSATQVLRLDHTLPPGDVFQTASDVPTGSKPQAIAIGDLDGDAIPDVVTANGASDDVSVLLGNGDGTFQPHMEYGDMVAPLRVVIADFNGDARPDIVVASANGASVLLGNGDGTFQPNVDYGPEINWVAVGDLNQDGKLDLATSGPDRFVGAMLGNGDGTFQQRIGSTRSSLSTVSSVEIGDMNGDGRDDIIIGATERYFTHGGYFVDQSCFETDIGNGDGGFSYKQNYILGFQSPMSVHLADVTQDGRLDALLTEVYSLGVTPGNGDGTFQYSVGPGGLGGVPYYYFGPNQVPWDVAVADFDNDHRPDVATSNLDVNGVTVLLGRAQYGLGSAINFPIATPARALAAGDLNRDTRPDLVVTDSDHAQVFVLMNAGHNGVVAVDTPPAAATAIDFVAPNPSRTTSGIHYSLAHDGHVHIEIADLAGRVVATVFDGVQAAGRYQAAWRGERLPAGLYFVRLTTPDRTIARKFTRLP